MNADDREQERQKWRAFGEWVRSSRAEQKPDAWTQQRLADELGVRREWVVQIEKGSKPGSDVERAIRRLFGEPPAAVPPAPDQSALIAALTAQTTAINRLADAVDKLLDRDQERAEEIIDKLGRIAVRVGVAAPKASGDAPAHTPASTQTEGGEQDPPRRRRTRASRLPKPGTPRTGWEEEQPPEVELSRGNGK